MQYPQRNKTIKTLIINTKNLNQMNKIAASANKTLSFWKAFYHIEKPFIYPWLISEVSNQAERAKFSQSLIIRYIYC